MPLSCYSDGTTIILFNAWHRRKSVTECEFQAICLLVRFKRSGTNSIQLNVCHRRKPVTACVFLQCRATCILLKVHMFVNEFHNNECALATDRRRIIYFARLFCLA